MMNMIYAFVQINNLVFAFTDFQIFHFLQLFIICVIVFNMFFSAITISEEKLFVGGAEWIAQNPGLQCGGVEWNE